MKQLASARVKCAVTEENKEILKRSLCRELDLALIQWKENEIQFKKTSCYRDYYFQINIDVLPDMKGYSFFVQSIEEQVHIPWLMWLFLGLIGIGATAVVSLLVIIAASFFVSKYYKYEISIDVAIVSFFVIYIIFVFIGGDFFNWYNDFRIKSQLKKALKQAFKAFDKD